MFVNAQLLLHPVPDYLRENIAMLLIMFVNAQHLLDPVPDKLRENIVMPLTMFVNAPHQLQHVVGQRLFATIVLVIVVLVLQVNVQFSGLYYYHIMFLYEVINN